MDPQSSECNAQLCEETPQAVFHEESEQHMRFVVCHIWLFVFVLIPASSEISWQLLSTLFFIQFCSGFASNSVLLIASYRLRIKTNNTISLPLEYKVDLKKCISASVPVLSPHSGLNKVYLHSCFVSSLSMCETPSYKDSGQCHTNCPQFKTVSEIISS